MSKLMERKVALAVVIASTLGVGAVAFTMYPPEAAPVSQPASSGETMIINETGEPVTVTPEPVVVEPVEIPVEIPVVETPTEPVAPAPEVPVAPEVTYPPLPPSGESNGYRSPDTLPYCEQEDSDNCYWDSRLLGNGKGQSFISINGHRYFIPTPVDE